MLSIKEYLIHPALLGRSLIEHYGQWLPDSIYLKLLFRLKIGYRLNLQAPKSFNEKLQWLKLYNRRPQYTTMVDKYAVKDYVASIIGNEYIIPTLGVWDKPEDIMWDSLPNQFVLKTTHGGGSNGVVICKDKPTLNKEKVINKLKASLKIDLYKLSKEWPYKNVPKRIIAEKYITPTSHEKNLLDYKFFCFDGEVKALFVATDRYTQGEEVKFDFFDADYNHLPFRQGHDHAKVKPQKPQSFEEMKTLASKLSRGIPQVRVDFYEVDGHPLFGEMTFFHFGGLVPFEPKEWDYEFGNWIVLPEKSDCRK